MIRTLLVSSSALLLSVSGCGKSEAPCEAIATRLCETAADHCDAARPWLAAQGAGDAAARDAACEAVLKDAPALAGYMARFAASVAPTPTVATPAPATPTPTADTPKPTVKDTVREVGATIEEVGNATDKAGEALDKLQDAVKTDSK